MKGQEGFALVHVMMLCVVLVLLSAAALQRGSSVATDNRVERGSLRAHYAAEGGLAVARHAMREHGEFATQELQLGTATVTVEVKAIEPGQWEIVARAAALTRGDERVVVTLREGFGKRYWYRSR